MASVVKYRNPLVLTCHTTKCCRLFKAFGMRGPTIAYADGAVELDYSTVNYWDFLGNSHHFLEKDFFIEEEEEPAAVDMADQPRQMVVTFVLFLGGGGIPI